MALVPLTKMHGARNDFLVIDLRAMRLELDGALVRRLCDRRSGVGADGLLTIEPSESAGVRMSVYNADGSQAEMCGNGVRCVARYLDELGEGTRLAIETDSGAIETDVIARVPEYLVRVAVGIPRVENHVDATFVSLGNPHVVFTVADVETFDLTARARAMQNDARFPSGVNVHCVDSPAGGSLRVRHWERGVGSTQACGTGIVAVAAAAIARGRARSPVHLVAPGGRFEVAWDGSGTAYLTGPAVRVFDTAVEIPERVRA